MRLNMPGFSAEAAIKNRDLGFFGGPRALGYIECTDDLCLCTGYDDCIEMMVFRCGPNIRCSDHAPICICEKKA